MKGDGYLINRKGKRIRASDKNLVYRFCAGTLLLLFVAVLLLLNMGQLMRTDWEHFSLLDNGVTLSTYNFITIGIATGVCALVAFLYYRFFHDSFKKLLHRQKLSRMILDNKWYEAQTVQDSGFFTDLQSRSREKIVWFPKIYYQMDTGFSISAVKSLWESIKTSSLDWKISWKAGFTAS